VYLSQPGSQGDSGTSESRADEPRTAIASAGRDGSFEFRGLVPGTYDVLGRSSDGRVGFLSDVVVRLGESASPTLVILAPGGKLRIRNDGTAGWGRYAVLSHGKTLAGGSVKAGSSVLVSVPAGSLTVRFFSNGNAPEERVVEVSAGDEDSEAAFSSD
jgi:hypothetical protein